MTDEEIAEKNHVTVEVVRELREDAKAKYARGSNDDIEIDENAPVSAGDDGAFVQAWVWVPFRRPKATP